MPTLNCATMPDFDGAQHLDGLGLVRTEHGYEWEIELVLSNDPDRDPPSLTDPVCCLDAHRARALAHELLELAQQAAWRPQCPGEVAR